VSHRWRLVANGRALLPRWLERRAWVRFVDAWKDELIPDQQLSLAESQVANWLAGQQVTPFDVLAELLDEITEGLPSVFEVGSSSGYYSEVIKHHRPESRYIGVDYSHGFCALGQRRFPAAALVCADTLSLPIRDAAFPLVISGSVLLHVHDWAAALRETLRVTSRYVILHRTPVTSSSTATFTKRAYGLRLIEWAFNEGELLDECAKLEFSLVKQIDLNEQATLSNDGFSPNNRSYLLRRL
jgi:SAM-dependent methyltransferase